MHPSTTPATKSDFAESPLLSACCGARYALATEAAHCTACGCHTDFRDGILHLTERTETDLRSGNTFDLHLFRNKKRYYDRMITSKVEYVALRHSVDFQRFHADLLAPYLQEAVVADLGCGQLLYGDAFACRGIKHYFGLDLDLPSLHLAKNGAPEGLKLTLVKQELGERLPFDDNAVDVVISSEVIEHLDDPFKYLREIRRILKPGGVLSISTPCGSMYLQPSSVLRAVKSPGRLAHWIDRVNSHKHWSRALEWHPALMPGIFKQWCESEGLLVLQQRTRLWYYGSRIQASWRLFATLERIGFASAGKWVSRYLKLSDTILDFGLPVVKWMGTRQFALCVKRNAFR